MAWKAHRAGARLGGHEQQPDPPPHRHRTPPLLERLRRTAGDPGRRILFTGATVLTMDPALGILDTGDLLVVGSTIAAVGPDLRAHGAAADAIVVDAAGTVLAPGFVDTHRHAWQAQLRRIMPDVNDLAGYVSTTLAEFAPAYRPHDMYVGTRLAALAAVDAGITTMLDFSHNSRSAAHPMPPSGPWSTAASEASTPPWARTSAPGTTSGPPTWPACTSSTATP
ncbi:hypothetical protein ACFQ0M_06245 [Kitasatospora aburaviensis]